MESVHVMCTLSINFDKVTGWCCVNCGTDIQEIQINCVEMKFTDQEKQCQHQFW